MDSDDADDQHKIHYEFDHNGDDIQHADPDDFEYPHTIHEHLIYFFDESDSPDYLREQNLDAVDHGKSDLFDKVPNADVKQ